MNLVKMNVYRAIKSKSTWVLFALTLIFTIAGVTDETGNMSLLERIELGFVNGNIEILMMLFVIFLSDKFKRYNFKKNIAAYYNNDSCMAGCVAVTGMIFWTFTFLCIMILSFIVGGSDFGEAVKIFVTLLPDFAEVMFFVVAIALMHACLENSVLTGFIGIVWINYFEGQIENVNIVGLSSKWVKLDAILLLFSVVMLVLTMVKNKYLRYVFE
ncbi:MAG: hypothetical protein UH963_04050 [Agathobacter sp.]|nr:hypothetical protein [Agathobacter sp.]